MVGLLPKRVHLSPNEVVAAGYLHSQAGDSVMEWLMTKAANWHLQQRLHGGFKKTPHRKMESFMFDTNYLRLLPRPPRSKLTNQINSTAPPMATRKL